MIWPLRILAVFGHWILSIAGAILGIFVVGWLAWRRAWRPGYGALGNTIWVWRPRWAWLWSDSDQGVFPGLVPTRWEAFKWSALRNKASNLRFVPGLGFMVNPSAVRSVGNCRNLYRPYANRPERILWSLTWQGIYSGLWIVIRPIKRQLRIGWALVPEDADRPIDRADLRQLWCGFTFQFNGAA